MRPWERLQHFWASTPFDVPTESALEAEVGALEERYGIILPDDFREYLLRSSPTDGNGCDDNFSLWWPLQRIRNIPEEYEHRVNNFEVAQTADRHLFFADHAIWAWAWAIACTQDENRGRVAVIGSDSDRFVADDFGQFVDLYINDFSALSP